LVALRKFEIFLKKYNSYSLRKEDEWDGRDGEDSEEADKDNGYDVSGWASIFFSDSDEDRGYGADCGRVGSGGVSFGRGMGGSDL
jgi:deferrochelatase/peroxidase EfeB